MLDHESLHAVNLGDARQPADGVSGNLALASPGPICHHRIMSATDAEAASAIDFAFAASREDGLWQVSALPVRAATELSLLLQALGQLPSDSGTLGMVSVDEDFFVLIRVTGGQIRLLLSDVGAA